VTALYRVTRGVAWVRLASALVCLVLAGPALAAQLVLNWIDTATDEDGFRIERRNDPPGTYSQIATVGPNVITYTDTSVTAGQGYCYRVRTYKSSDNSAYSNEACGTATTASSWVVGDTTPPVRWNGLPTGILPGGTTQATLSLVTDENATCRWATAANTPYGSMPNTFSLTGGVAHSSVRTGLVNGGSYTYYVRCRDAAGNANTTDYSIRFSVSTVSVTAVTAKVTFPVPVGTAITWTATATGGSGSYQYQFFRRRTDTGGYVIVQPYSASASYTWTPGASDVGSHQVAVRVRNTGSSAPVEARGTSAVFTITTSVPQVTALTANRVSLQAVGTALTWTATATGGSGSYQYQFFRRRTDTGGYVIVQPYGASASYRWTPGAGDVGTHQVAVWVRNAGSSAPVEAGGTSALFTVTATSTASATFTPSTFAVSGLLTNEGCTSPLRNGRAATLGSIAASTDTGGSFTGTLTVTFPLVPGAQTSGPFNATVDATGNLSGTFTYAATQGSTTVSSGTGSLAGTLKGTTLSVELTGQSVSGETCDFTGWLVSPSIPVTFMAFHHDATVGSLDEIGGAFVPVPTFPVSIGRYRVLFEVAGDTAPFTPPGNVLFTGPAGSQLSDTGGIEMDQLATNVVEYHSPWVSSPPIAPPGDWTEEYEGQYYNSAMEDPQAADRLVVPVPTFVQTNGQLTRVDWAYRAGDGSMLAGAPAFIRLIRLQILDPCGLLLHDSLARDPTTMTRTLGSAVTLASVAEVRFLYGDDLENVYMVRYGRLTLGDCK
jgi:hypothetical protein